MFYFCSRWLPSRSGQSAIRRTTHARPTHDPASGITGLTRSNDAYAFAKANVSETGTANGLNQLTAYAGKSLTHDARGNTTAFGTDIFGYSSENLMKSATVAGTSSTLAYDPLTRLYQTSSGTTLRFAYDGLDSIAEYDGSNALQRRYVFGPGVDEPIVWYEGSGTTNRRFLSSDERGSIISVTDSSGTLLGINKYDEYGNPANTNLGAFGYTAQRWLPAIKVSYYKARMYNPADGRFMQTDPIGYAGDGPNLYAYTLNDPVNYADSLGLCEHSDVIIIVCNTSDIGGGGFGSASVGSANPGGAQEEIIVRGPHRAIPLPGLQPANCTLCNAIITGNWEAGFTITGRRGGTGEAPFFFNGARWAADPLYRKPWWSNYFDYRFACLAVCPLGMIAAVDLAPSAIAMEIPEDAYSLQRALQAGEKVLGRNPGRYGNREGLLPQGEYRKFDVNPSSPRGPERMIYDPSTGRAWYTPDHYSSFFPL